MRLVVIGTVLLAALVLVSAPHTAAGWWWDMANGLGFAACVLLLCVCILTGKPPPAGAGLAFHRHLGWAAIVAVGLHVAMMLADRTTWDYLLPGAPAYMWAGLAACVPLLLLAVSGLRRYRRAWFVHNRAFRSAHLVWTFSLLALLNWHILGSGLYLSNLPLQMAFVALTCGVPLALWLLRDRLGPAVPMDQALAWPYTGAVAILALFVLARAI